MNMQRLHEIAGLMLKFAEELGRESDKVEKGAAFADVHASFCVSVAANSCLDTARALMDAGKALRGEETQTAASVR